MRRTTVTALAAVTFVVFVSGCTDVPPEPRGAAFPADFPQAAGMTVTGVIQSVTGNGHLVDGPVERTVTFNICKHDDGSVDGWYHALRRGPGGAHIRVQIECLHVVGNEAWATGTVVAAENPDNIGLPYSICFIDNGEEDGSAPDEVGVARFVYYDCTTEPEISLRQLTKGNLQIRG